LGCEEKKDLVGSGARAPISSARAPGENMKFRVLIEQDEDGVFVAQVPSLPGCVSQGQTRADAIANVQEAIAGYLESLSDRNEAIPPAIDEEVVDVAV
jgi:predicted RNase H-like HicB family nuclease